MAELILSLKVVSRIAFKQEETLIRLNQLNLIGFGLCEKDKTAMQQQFSGILDGIFEGRWERAFLSTGYSL